MALRTIRIFISSPGDVAEERLLARRLIGRLDAQFGGALQFEAILWERFPLVATASFQEQLQRPSDADIVIVVLWSRLGTPLPAHITRPDGSRFASGTEFEFEDAVDGFRRSGTPRILTYLKTAPLTPAGDLASLEDATRQKRALERFVSTWFRNEADGTLKGAFHHFATSADFEDLLDAHLTQLAEQFVPPGMTARSRAATWKGRSPFRGLQAFDAEHAPVFFGRTAATAAILAKLRVQGQAGRAFVLIVSMSGGGKSSLLRAGVLPLLLQPGIVGPATIWRRADMRPSDGEGRPLAALERVLLRATAVDASEPALALDDASDSPSTLVERIAARVEQLASATRADPAEAPVCHVALIVDQLEEAFTDERIVPAERDAFFEAIDALARCGFVWVLSTMRSDAYSRIAEVPALVVLKEGDGQFDLLPPTVREIGQIIRLPAAAAGLHFETRPNTAEKLDDVIRDAAARNPNALPLLQFLLEELYLRRSADDALTFKAYEDLGGVEGALVQRAETVLDGVGEDARASLPVVVRELVTFGLDDDSRAVRRIAPRSAFAAPAANELVDALLEARLLISASDSDGAPVVSLAHEALLEFWPRVKSLVDEDRELLVVHARLEGAAREWERNARSGDLMLSRGKPLSEALELARAGIRLSASETALLAASQRRARRFAIARGGAITGLAVLAVVAGVAAYRARVESGRAQVQATTAQRTTDFMVSLFANADPDQSKGDTVTVRDVLDRGVVQIEQELKGEDAVRANLLRAMGQAYTGLGLFAKAKPILQQAVEQSERSASPDDLLKAQRALGTNLFEDGNYVEAERIYRDSLTRAIALHGETSDASAIAEFGLADSMRKQGNFEEAEKRFRHVLGINRVLHAEPNLETAKELDALGMLLVVQARYAEAEPLLIDSLAMRKQLLGPRHGQVSLALNNLGSLYFRVGQYDRAVEYWTESLDIDRQIYGANHPYVASSLNNLGRVELLSNRLEPARQHLSEALAIQRKALSPEHDDFVPPLNSLAMIFIAQDDFVSARPLLVEALAIAQKRQHPYLSQVLGNTADLDAWTGQLGEASDLLAEARSALNTSYGEGLKTNEAWRSAILDLTQAEIDARSGKAHDADVLLSGALTVLTRRFGADNFYVARAHEIEKQVSLNQ